jgi:hypothetical protein
MALYAPDGLLHLIVLDMGSGDAILLQTPDGHSVLVNGDPSPSNLRMGWDAGFRHLINTSIG